MAVRGFVVFGAAVGEPAAACPAEPGVADAEGPLVLPAAVWAARSCANVTPVVSVNANALAQDINQSRMNQSSNRCSRAPPTSGRASSQRALVADLLTGHPIADCRRACSAISGLHANPVVTMMALRLGGTLLVRRERRESAGASAASRVRAEYVSSSGTCSRIAATVRGGLRWQRARHLRALSCALCRTPLGQWGDGSWP